MEDEPALQLPNAPRLTGALREAFSDFYYNSWRLVPANVIWGVLLLVVAIAASLWLPLALAAGALAVPVAGIYRMAVLIQRGRSVSFHDFIDGMRRFGLPALGLGLAGLFIALVLTANIFIGLEMGGLAGPLFSAFALYGSIGLAMFLVAAWPILVDPLRAHLSVRRRLWLAVALNFAHPLRMLALTFVLAVIVLVSAFLLAALLTVSLAYVSLCASRYVLPAIDRLEGRPSVPVDE